MWRHCNVWPEFCLMALVIAVTPCSLWMRLGSGALGSGVSPKPSWPWKYEALMLLPSNDFSTPIWTGICKEEFHSLSGMLSHITDNSTVFQQLAQVNTNFNTCLCQSGHRQIPLGCFPCCCWPEQAVEHAVELPAIWDAITLICDIIIRHSVYVFITHLQSIRCF